MHSRLLRFRPLAFTMKFSSSSIRRAASSTASLPSGADAILAELDNVAVGDDISVISSPAGSAEASAGEFIALRSGSC